MTVTTQIRVEALRRALTTGDSLLKEFKVSPEELEGSASAEELLACVWPILKGFEESEQRRRDVAG